MNIFLMICILYCFSFIIITFSYLNNNEINILDSRIWWCGSGIFLCNAIKLFDRNLTECWTIQKWVIEAFVVRGLCWYGESQEWSTLLPDFNFQGRKLVIYWPHFHVFIKHLHIVIFLKVTLANLHLISLTIGYKTAD